MTGYEIPNLRFSTEAGAAVARRRFVSYNAAGAGIQTGAGQAAIGVSLNAPATGEVLEIVDGIVMVEAGGIVAANAIVQSDADGKAITLVAGVPLAVALTAATVAGQMIAVKTPCAGSSVRSLFPINYQIDDLGAGVDIAAIPLFQVPVGYVYDITAITVLMQGATAGVDDANTSVFTIAVGAATVVTKTYNTATQPPASGAGASLGAIANGHRVAGDIIALSVTNGATANLPGVMLQITGTLTAV